MNPRLVQMTDLNEFLERIANSEQTPSNTDPTNTTTFTFSELLKFQIQSATSLQQLALPLMLQENEFPQIASHVLTTALAEQPQDIQLLTRITTHYTTTNETLSNKTRIMANMSYAVEQETLKLTGNQTFINYINEKHSNLTNKQKKNKYNNITKRISRVKARFNDKREDFDGIEEADPFLFKAFTLILEAAVKFIFL